MRTDICQFVGHARINPPALLMSNFDGGKIWDLEIRMAHVLVYPKMLSNHPGTIWETILQKHRLRHWKPRTHDSQWSVGKS